MNVGDLLARLALEASSFPTTEQQRKSHLHRRNDDNPHITPTATIMGDAEITASSWRLVEVGRVVLIHGGSQDGKLATIVEIIDHKRALVDGPSTDSKTAVPRQSIALAQCILTPLVLEKLPRGARTGVVKAAWEKAGIEAKWQESAWAKKRTQKERRRALTDFERFKVTRLRKQSRFEVRKSLAKVKAAAK